MNWNERLVTWLAIVAVALPSLWASGQEKTVIIEDDGALREVDVQIYDVDAPGVEKTMNLVEFEAISIGRTTKAMVLLPDGYDADEEKRYPVLYLLHGLLQNYTVWPMLGAAHYLAKYDMIIVMPDAGNSWYVNWSESFNNELNNWEDFIIYDLIHTIDETFNTIPSREGRAINGLSMGGYGAITLGLRHPSMFSSIGSHSGALGFARNSRTQLEAGGEPQRNTIPAPLENDRDENVSDLIKIPGFTMQHERYPDGIAFNTVEESNLYDPFELITRIPPRMLPHIYLDCGLQDGLMGVTQEFAAVLMGNNIPFSYSQTPGEHRPSYWSRELSQSMAVQYSVLERNVAVWQARQEQAALEAAAALEEAGEPVEEIAEAPAHEHQH